MESTSNGIMFLEDIVSINGAAFTLFPESSRTQQDIQAAVNEIKGNRDMIAWHIATEHDRDQHYITLIFRSPLIRKLRWYEINMPAKLIRTERIKGTSVEGYIKQYVLPFTEKIKAENMTRYGEKLLL
jgi:hypothetical protein